MNLSDPAPENSSGPAGNTAGTSYSGTSSGFNVAPAGEFAVHSPSGRFTLTWGRDTRFFLLRNSQGEARAQVDGLAVDGPNSYIQGGCVADSGHFALAVGLIAAVDGPGSATQRTTVVFVADPEGYRRMRVVVPGDLTAMDLAPSGNWLLLHAGAVPVKAHAGLLHLFNTSGGQLVWTASPWSGFRPANYRFDETMGQVLLVRSEGRVFPYRLGDGHFPELAAYRAHLLQHGDAVDLCSLARQELQSLEETAPLDAAVRRDTARIVFDLLTAASQRAPESTLVFLTLGQFFEWLPDHAKAIRCYTRACELGGESTAGADAAAALARLGAPASP